MGIIEILKSPYKGEFCNSKLKIKESIIIASILALVFSIVFIASAKVLVGDLSTGLVGGMIEGLFNKMLFRAFILLIVNHIGIILGFSAIIFAISKMIFKVETTYEEIVSICTYAAIIPTSIMLIGMVFSFLSVNLSAIFMFIQILVLIILTYEGLSSVIKAGKSKFIYSIATTYIVNIVLFVLINYLIIRSMVESSVANYFY